MNAPTVTTVLQFNLINSDTLVRFFLRKCMQTLTLLTLSRDTKKGCCDIDCNACDMLCGQWESLVVIIDSSNTYPAQFRVPTQWGLIIQAQIISLNYYDGNN